MVGCMELIGADKPMVKIIVIFIISRMIQLIRFVGTLQLLSSSIDKTLIIWTTTDDGVWMEKIRVGDVGGNSLGFYGGKFSPDGQSIMGHGFHGSFHIWRQNREDASSWLPGIVVGGHFSMVQDLAWEPNGLFLLTVSSDQTSRIHVPWVRPSLNEHV